jgi:hypothetical protein
MADTILDPTDQFAKPYRRPFGGGGAAAWTNWRQERLLRRESRDAKRGYSINLKRVGTAYAVELMIITVSLCGNWLLTRRYGHGDFDNVAMMMLAPIAYAVVEFCRVPIAIGARIQTSPAIKLICCIGVVLAAGITTKTVSQIGEMMFEPRLHDVQATELVLGEAKADWASLASKIDAADRDVSDRDRQLKEAHDTEQTALKQTAAIPKDTCYPTSWTDRQGQYHQSTACRTNTTRETVNRATQAAGDRIAAAEQALDTAKAARGQLDKGPIDKRVAEAAKAYQDAVGNSQLHSFAAMVFGIAPTDVTDAQLHWFLRLFVFIPAICSGFVATIIALTSVTRLEPENVAVNPAGLSSLGAAVYAEAHHRVIGDLAHIVATTVQKEKERV